MSSSSEARQVVLLDVSDEVAVALVELDRVKDQVGPVQAPGVLDGIERAEDSLRRLQARVVELLAMTE